MGRGLIRPGPRRQKGLAAVSQDLPSALQVLLQDPEALNWARVVIFHYSVTCARVYICVNSKYILIDMLSTYVFYVFSNNM